MPHKRSEEAKQKRDEHRRVKALNTKYDPLMAESYCTEPFEHTIQVFSKGANRIVDVLLWASRGEITWDSRGRGCLQK